MDATDMLITTSEDSNPRNGVARATHQSEPCWYAAYTCANHEKRVVEQLSERSVENYLPLYDSIRRWKDRRVNLQLPLFPGYVFVHLALCDRLRVLGIPGVAKLVGFNGAPAVIPDIEIEALKNCLRGGLLATPHPYLKVGRHVRIESGPLSGLEGILIRIKNKMRFVISIDLIQRSILLDVDAASLVPVASARAAKGTPNLSFAR